MFQERKNVPTFTLCNVKMVRYVTLSLTLSDVHEPNFYVQKPQIWAQFPLKLRLSNVI